MNNAKITGTVTKEITVRGDVKHTYISSGGGGGGGATVCASALVTETITGITKNATFEEV